MSEPTVPEGQAELIAQLTLERNKLQSIVAAMPSGLTIQDRDFNILYQSPLLQKIFGRQGEKCYRVYESQEAICPGCPVALAFADGQVHSSVRTVKMPSGKMGVWQNTASPIRDAEGQVTSCLEVVTEITERLQIEENFHHAQKMEAVGQVAGGIAHDFNNVLAVITMQLSMLRQEPNPPASELAAVVDELLEATTRAAALSRQMLLFTRRQAMRTARHDASAIVVELSKLLQRVLGERVRLEVSTWPEPLWFDGDAGLLEQVVMNLCIRARDAMPNGGQLTILTRPSARPDLASPHGFLQLQVSDTGAPLSEAERASIFERSPGEGGAGLGLAAVKSIVARHNGRVEVDGHHGGGSTFSVFLPRSAALLAPQPRQVLRAAGAGERILVVEDEGAVRRIAMLCLRRLGYQVVEAATGVEALRVWEEEGGRFNLLFTDLVMPDGLSGVELCARLRQARPQLKLLVATGYAAEAAGESAAALRGVTILHKPYDVDTLAAAVRASLDREVASPG